MASDQITISRGSVFTLSSRNGDIRHHTTDGFYAYDTRFLSLFRLTIGGREAELVGVDVFDHSMTTFYTTSSRETFSIVRDRYIADGLHEDVSIVNHSVRERSLHLEITIDADFADVFEVRQGQVHKKGEITVNTKGSRTIVLTYRRGDFKRETRITFSSKALIQRKKAVFEIDLKPKEIWKTCIEILPVFGSNQPRMKCANEILGTPFGAYKRRDGPGLSHLKQDLHRPLYKDLPTLQTDNLGLLNAYHQAQADLRSLQIEFRKGHHILAAGVPWFMAVFGRDSIISAIQTKLLGPELMTGTLQTLASLQADTFDQFREAEPGKIPHEVREGELSLLEEVPHSRYYGSIDATPLFLILLWETFQWTGNRELLTRMLPVAENALSWVDSYGDADGDGFLEYKAKTKQGLRNQGWKDSWDSTSFADGRIAEAPIALAEVQGYAYDARIKMAQIYRILGDEKKAQALDEQARDLKERFNKAFWMSNEGYFAIALDKRKQKVDSIASNAGQCLWTGIVDQRKAKKVVKRLMAPDMFSGWGIRTLSTEMARYNPLSYHNGSIWPHDNSLIAAGMARYGFRKEANEVAYSIIDAATAFQDNRLPELFAGYPRREFSFPVPYPAANAPQAWASGALIYLLEILLGVVPDGARLLREAQPDGILISLKGVLYRGSKWNL